MRPFATLLICLIPTLTSAQTPEIVAKVNRELQTLRYIQSLYDADTGGYKIEPTGKPGMRTCNSAAKVIKYLGGKLENKDKSATFILKCYDPATGTFSEPGGKPDVASTSLGVITAVEYGIPKAKFAKALDYLKENAKTWEDVRIGAAAIEAVDEKPDWLIQWDRIANAYGRTKLQPAADGGAREVGSLAAYRLRLGKEIEHREDITKFLTDGQRPDGGWGKAGATASDFESTYRVMRAFMLLQKKPADPAKLRAFAAQCRNKDGGYGVEPGKPSNLSGTYYAVTVLHWLDELEK